MPLEGHPDDCACCVQIRFTPGARGTKRPPPVAEETPLELPEAAAPSPPYDWEEEGGEEEAEVAEAEEDHTLLNASLFKAFDAHVDRLDAARLKRIEALSFKSALEDDGEGGEVNEDASLDEIEGLGMWMPGDEFQGDVNYRTLQKLLTRVDQRGFERSAQQLEASVSEYGGRTRGLWVESPASSPLDQFGFLLCARAQFHVAFMKAAARVIYRGSWETERPAIMKKYGWEKSNSEVLIRYTLNPSNPAHFSSSSDDHKRLVFVCAVLLAALARRIRALTTRRSPH